MIDFIQPSFNEFTLNFPPEPRRPDVLVNHLQIMDMMHEKSAEQKIIAKAAARKDRRTRQRLESLMRGGWIIEFEPRQHFGLQTSTRGQRRREKLGRA